MGNNMQPLLYLFGASGHAKVILDILEQAGEYRVHGLLDDNPSLWGTQVFGYPVLGGKEVLRQRPLPVIVSIGNNAIRYAIAHECLASSMMFGQALHPRAAISRGVIIGAGSVIMAGAVVNADAQIGAHVIINTGATVDHDCVIGDVAHIAPGAHLCGGIAIGARTLIGAGATVIPNLRIGADVVVGAGATVISDLPDGVMAVGAPARIVKTFG